jgi:hypothetical protein
MLVQVMLACSYLDCMADNDLAGTGFVEDSLQ